MQNDRTLKDFPFRGPLYIHEKAPREQILQNNHKHGSRRKDFNKNKDTLKTQVLLWLQLIALVQNWTQFSLMTCMTILTVWEIPMHILTLLIHKNKTQKILISNKNNYMKTQMMTWSLNKNSNIFTQTLIGISIYNNELRYHVNSSQWYRKHNRWYGIFSPIPQLTPKSTQGQTLHPTNIKFITAQLDGG